MPGFSSLPKRDELLVDLGFFRPVLEDMGDPTNPIFWGCACACVIFDFVGSRTSGEPSTSFGHPNAKVKVEWGKGTDPFLSYEASRRAKILEGQGRIDLLIRRLRDSKFQVFITFDPQWFSVGDVLGR